jgi:hypothetical protein
MQKSSRTLSLKACFNSFINNKKIHTILLINMICISVLAQKGLQIESSLFYGHIIKPNDRIKVPVPSSNTGTALELRYQTFGKKDWHTWQHYPALGATFIYYKLGDPNILGEAIGVVPHIKFRLLDTKICDISTQFGFGIAYLTKHYDQIDNPQNNAIGSAVNNCTNFQLRSEWRLSPKWNAIAGATFTHYSNGASQLPNLGLNIPAMSLGLQYNPEPVEKADRLVSKLSKKSTHRWGVNVHLDMAYRESMVSRGPRYPVYIASLAGMYHWTKVNRFMFGAEYEQQTDVKKFGLSVGAFQTEKEARFHSSRVMAFVGNEFLFGNWSFSIQTGAYIGNKNWYLSGYKLYNKIGMRYYLPPIGKPQTKFYVGLYMKAHRIVAEYIGMGIGAAF